MRFRARRFKARAHFLHVGKTGGTAINTALSPLTQTGRYEIVLDGHDVDLRQIPDGEAFFFVLRDPLERFVSSFNDRKRCSRPRYDVPWTDDETLAYGRFDTADALGRALSCQNDAVREAAVAAMRGIYHVRHSYWHWFGDPAYFQSRLGDLLYVLWLDSLPSSFARLCALLDLHEAELPTDAVGAHRDPGRDTRYLSEPALENLKRWYRADYEFVELCHGLDQAAPELRSVAPPHERAG